MGYVSAHYYWQVKLEMEQSMWVLRQNPIDFIVFRRPLVVVESCREKLAKGRILVTLRFMKINLTRDVVSIANKTLNEAYSWYIKSGKYINVWVTKQSNV